MDKMKNYWGTSVHTPTQEQIKRMLPAEGELNLLPAELQKRINDCPSKTGQLKQLADDIIEFCINNNARLYQPGGSLALLFTLGKRIGAREVEVYFAHSPRIAQETTQLDGSVKKTSYFSFKRWVEV